MADRQGKQGDDPREGERKTEQSHVAPHHRGGQTMHHRKAYGAHRTVTGRQKALFIAESITRREAEGRSWTWAEYGIEGNSSMIERVHAALQQHAA